jgi:hypothetical protein
MKRVALQFMNVPTTFVRSLKQPVAHTQWTFCLTRPLVKH